MMGMKSISGRWESITHQYKSNRATQQGVKGVSNLNCYYYSTNCYVGTRFRILIDDGLINQIQARWEAISQEYKSDTEPQQGVAGTAYGRDQIESIFTTSAPTPMYINIIE